MSEPLKIDNQIPGWLVYEHPFDSFAPHLLFTLGSILIIRTHFTVIQIIFVFEHFTPSKVLKAVFKSDILDIPPGLLPGTEYPVVEQRLIHHE